ncbi:MAG: hypothetical protein V4754_21925 [Pseudomonadota bacterium]
MNRPAITRTAVLFCLFAASRAFAAGEVHQCVGADGHLTLTDQSCEAVGLSAVAPARGDAPPRAPLAAPRTLAPAPAVAPMPAAARREATDVATLKAARASLLVADAASSRHARLAALD